MMDLSLLLKLMDGDQQMVDRFVSIFKAQAPDQVSALAQLCENQDWERLSTALHSLKTQFSYVGMKTLSECTRNLEEAVDTGQTGDIAFRVAYFIEDFNYFWKTAFPAAGR